MIGILKQINVSKTIKNFTIKPFKENIEYDIIEIEENPKEIKEKINYIEEKYTIPINNIENKYSPYGWMQ